MDRTVIAKTGDTDYDNFSLVGELFTEGRFYVVEFVCKRQYLGSKRFLQRTVRCVTKAKNKTNAIDIAMVLRKKKTFLSCFEDGNICQLKCHVLQSSALK